jgi:transposase
MHVATIRRRHGDRVYESHLVRRSIREGKRVRHETIANVSRLPPAAIEALQRALRGEALMAAGEAFAIEDPLPHGHVEALLAAARRLGLARLLDRAPSRERDLALALICVRVIAPGSKLATARALGRSTLAAELSVEGADQDDLYAAMDWLLERQERVEGRLARRHLQEGELVLYDVSSSYFEGRTCPLAELGFSRDGKRGTPQVVYGLLCDRRGCPVSVEAFKGSLHDDKTLPDQLAKLRDRFKLTRIAVVSDRGMVTKANLEAMRSQDGVAWITALKAPQVKRLAKRTLIQPSLFDEHSLAEIEDPDEYPGERLIVCRNPLVAAERARKREDLLEATERELSEIARRVEAGTLVGEAAIGLAAGAIWNRYRVKKHFRLEIADTSFAFERKSDQIAAEAALDGIYVIRTSVADDALDSPDVVRSYKQLKEVERAFRSFKGPLEVRPIHHRLEDRVRAHIFVCMLAYYLEWHLRQAWAELLFKDEHPPTPTDPVAKASRSAAADRKARTKRTNDGRPCHSFHSLLAELALRTRNTIRPHGTNAAFTQLSEPTELHTRALALIERIPTHA